MQQNEKNQQNLIISIVALTLAILAVGGFYLRDFLNESSNPYNSSIGRSNIREIKDPPLLHKETKETPPVLKKLPEEENKPKIPADSSQSPIIKKQKEIIKETPVKEVSKAKGDGKLTLYTTCTDCSVITIFIDEKPAGTLTGALTTPPSCNAPGTLSISLPVGRHHLSSRDKKGNSKDVMVTIVKGKCVLQEI